MRLIIRIYTHVIAKFITSMSHSVTCSDLTGLLKLCSVFWAWSWKYDDCSCPVKYSASLHVTATRTERVSCHCSCGTACTSHSVPPVVHVKPKSCNHALLNQLSISNTQRECKRRTPMLFDYLIDQQIPLCHFSRSCGNCHSRLNPWVIWYLETLRQLSVNFCSDHARLALSASHRNQSEFQRASSIKRSMIRLLISSIIESYCNLSLSNVSNVWITHLNSTPLCSTM